MNSTTRITDNDRRRYTQIEDQLSTARDAITRALGTFVCLDGANELHDGDVRIAAHAKQLREALDEVLDVRWFAKSQQGA